MYLDRQAADIEGFRRDEAVTIPDAVDYGRLAGLSNELREKLRAARPATLGQAARIDGMTPAALTLLLAAVKRRSPDRLPETSPSADGPEALAGIVDVSRETATG